MKVKLRGQNRIVEVKPMQVWEDTNDQTFVIVAEDPLRKDCFVISMFEDEVLHTYADIEFLSECYFVKDKYIPIPIPIPKHKITVDGKTVEIDDETFKKFRELLGG